MGLKQSLYSLIGEISRHIFEIIEPHIEEILKILVVEITDNTEIYPTEKERFNVYNNAIWAFGEIMYRSDPNKTSKYVRTVLPRLLTFASARHFITVLKENSGKK